MFRRRFYYDLTYGNCIYCYTAEGDINLNYTVEQEAEALGLENWGVFAWDAKYPEVEEAFSIYDAEGNLREVRAYVEDGELKFEYTPIVVVVPDDPYKIIDTLTGEVV